jgi:hypothetical protein
MLNVPSAASQEAIGELASHRACATSSMISPNDGKIIQPHSTMPSYIPFHKLPSRLKMSAEVYDLGLLAQLAGSPTTVCHFLPPHLRRLISQCLVVFHEAIQGSVSRVVALLNDGDGLVRSAAGVTIGRLTRHGMFHSRVSFYCVLAVVTPRTIQPYSTRRYKIASRMFSGY